MGSDQGGRERENLCVADWPSPIPLWLLGVVFFEAQLDTKKGMNSVCFAQKHALALYNILFSLALLVVASGGFVTYRRNCDPKIIIEKEKLSLLFFCNSCVSANVYRYYCYLLIFSLYTPGFFG